MSGEKTDKKSITNLTDAEKRLAMWRKWLKCEEPSIVSESPYWCGGTVGRDVETVLAELERLREELAKYKSGDDHVFYKTPGGVLP